MLSGDFYASCYCVTWNSDTALALLQADGEGSMLGALRWRGRRLGTCGRVQQEAPRQQAGWHPGQW